MSLGKQRNLIIIAAVSTALLAGTVLLGGYLPGAAQTDEQVKTCPSAGAGVTCAAKADGASFPQIVAATDAKPSCGAQKPVAGSGCEMAAAGCEKPEGGCEMAAAGCEKPEGGCEMAAAGCEKPEGGCEKAAAGCEKPEDGCEKAEAAEAAGGCCAAKADAAAE